MDHDWGRRTQRVEAVPGARHLVQILIFGVGHSAFALDKISGQQQMTEVAPLLVFAPENQPEVLNVIPADRVALCTLDIPLQELVLILVAGAVSCRYEFSLLDLIWVDLKRYSLFLLEPSGDHLEAGLWPAGVNFLICVVEELEFVLLLVAFTD